MDIYTLPEIQKQYFSHSQYSPPAPAPSAYLVTWPASYAVLAAEKPFLDEALEKPDYDKASLADRVFGRQIKHTRLSARRLAKLLDERCALHYTHMAEIRHQNLKCQEYLFVAKLHAQADGGRRLSSLEKLLVQLESDKRREDLVFWKDSVELRNALFEKAQEYATARDRASILEPFGGTHDLV